MDAMSDEACGSVLGVWPMIVLLVLIFSLVALGAAAFVVLRSCERPRRPRGQEPPALDGGRCGPCTMALGLGTYACWGSRPLPSPPDRPVRRTDYPALITMLAAPHARPPGDIEGWTLLGGATSRSATLPRRRKRSPAPSRSPKRHRDSRRPSCCRVMARQCRAAGGSARRAEAVFSQVLEEDPKDW